tara:strand:- start:57687 stop:59333 length:1647 start_codon:yes stop_codon:yes gene_type:complete
MSSSNLNLSNQRILVIDDLVDSRSIMKRMLTELGAERIDTAVDGDQAIMMINDTDYDLVLSDYNLGRGKDGQQVLEEARYTKRLRARSIFIMVTGENASDMVMGALEYEPDSYITKPITLKSLSQRLGRIMQGRRIMASMHQLMDAGKTQEAIAEAERLIASQPRMMTLVSRGLGPLYIHQEEYNNAIRVYSMVLNQHFHSWARLGQAICMHKLGDSLSALALLKETLRRQPRHVQCYDWMARIYLSLGDQVYAQKLLVKAVEISPRAVLRQRELGQLALQNQEWQVAASAFEQAVRLGRHSCYKSIDAYLNYADAALPLIESDKVTYKRLGDKVQRVLTDLQQDFSQSIALKYAGVLAQARICHAMGLLERGLLRLNAAEHLFREMEVPDADDALSLTSTMIQCGEHVRAEDLLRTVKGMTLSAAQQARVEQQANTLNEAAIRQHSDQVNAVGVSLYEQGEYMRAMKAFDEAADYSEAGVSVLLNAIQVRVSLINHGPCSQDQRRQLLFQCRPLFQRIGAVGHTDERFERFQRLKNNFTRLLQEPAS